MVGPPLFRKHFFPLLLLLLLVSIFILFSLSGNRCHTPIPISSSYPIDSPTRILNPPGASTFTFIIKVLAFNRLDSLARCLHSLANADYDGDTIHLHVYVDHFPLSNDSQEVLDRKLEQSRGILEFVDGFSWNIGNKVVQYRTANVGLQAQWLEAWWPSSDHEFVFVVEDDLEVSPLYYKFVRSLIVNYYYNVSNFSPSIYGASLQRPRFVPGKHGNKIQLDNSTHLFLYQLVGTWGQILFPKHWKEFRLWYNMHKAKGLKPFLDGMVTNGWYKKLGERIWTPWFIKFVHSRGYFNIYTNFQQERALSVSHRDAGVNYGKTAGPDSHLLDKSSLNFNHLEMQPLSSLKWYDYCFREVLAGRVVRTLDDLGLVLSSVQNQRTILLVSIFGSSEIVIRNLLCHFKRLNIRNYILMGPRSGVLFDLARRGHPVIDADQLLDSIKSQKLVTFQDSSTKLMMNMVVRAYVIKKCLEDGYNSWTVDANILFIERVPFHEFNNLVNDFYAGKMTDFFFAKSSPSAQRIWSDGFLHKVAAIVGQVSMPRERRNFVSMVGKLLQQNGASIGSMDETSFGTKIDPNSVNISVLENGKKMVYWSTEMGLDTIKEKLGELSMWVVDVDSSCMAVVCHQS